MICRYWRGWTTPENADAYEKLIRHDIMPGIAARNIPGFRPLSDFTARYRR